jgi:flavorubredoxin
MYSNRIQYIGCDDVTLDLFESQYPLPNGMCYNSYLLHGERVAVMDSVDTRKTNEWLQNIKSSNCTPHYLVVQHMEPDHSGSIGAFLAQYPETIVVGSRAALLFIEQFGYHPAHTMMVKHGDTLDLGGLTLHFVAAPMVHWPEVMMTYVPEEKTLFSADAFGSFGVYSNYAAHWIDEARRYYINICGKYGAQVSAALAKIEALDILNIAPLHGCVLEGAQLTEARRLYGIWSKYEVEHEGVLVAYASIHGNTSKVAQNIAETLRTNGMKVKEIDLCRTDVSEAVAQAFCYGKMVLCASSYDAGVFPPMHVFLYKLGIKGYQSRQVALVENGSWAPSAGKTMRGMLEAMKEIQIVEPMVTIRSAWKDEYQEELNTLIDSILR